MCKCVYGNGILACKKEKKEKQTNWLIVDAALLSMMVFEMLAFMLFFSSLVSVWCLGSPASTDFKNT